MTDEVNLPMTPTPVPQIVREHRADTRVLRIGPPPGMTEEQCGTVEALLGRIGGFPAVADYWRPDAEQLEVLNAGGFIELVQYVPQMIMHSLSVWPATAPGEQDDVAADPPDADLQPLLVAAAAVVDGYSPASWTARAELIDQLRTALADYIRSEPS